MTLSKLVGSIYYQSMDGVRTEFRITKHIDENTVGVTFTTGEKKKMSVTEINNEWYLLQPDGYINFSIVKINGLDDVVITMIREQDMDTNIPWCVCRQNINNIFEMMTERKDGVISSGVSVTQENIPAGMNILATLAGDKLVKTYMVAVYNTDKMSDILNCIKVKTFNKVLEQIFEVKLDSVNVPFIKKIMDNQESYAGCHKTLQGLLTECDFMHDVYRGFGHIVCDNICISEEDIIKGDFNSGALINIDKVLIIEKAFANRLHNPIVVKYTKDINLDEFENKFLFVDAKHDVFIMIYDDKSTLYEDENRMSPDERLINIM